MKKKTLSQATASFLKVCLIALWCKLSGRLVLLKDTEPEVLRRRAKCDACPLMEFHGDLPFCSQCRCYIPVKTRIAFESCPLKNW